MTRRGVTLLEVLFVAGLILLLLVVASQPFISGRRSLQKLSVQASLQTASRKAIARFLTEVQEGMEVLVPRSGRSRAHAVIRDKLSLTRWFVLHPQKGPGGLFELWRYYGAPAPAELRSGELLLSGIKRLRFTCQSEGALSVNLVLAEEAQEYSLVTTVRLRNLASAEAVW